MRALITGAAGQDGLLLSYRLHELGIKVYAALRPGQSSLELQRCCPTADVIEMDLGDSSVVRDVGWSVRPDFIFNFGGVSSLARASENPEKTWAVNYEAVVAFLDVARRALRSSHVIRIFQASSPLATRAEAQVAGCEYSKAKRAAAQAIQAMRANHGVYASTGILYGHESPLRSPLFFTRKVSQGVASVYEGLTPQFELEALQGCRDWGWAPEYVEGIRKQMLLRRPVDLVFATGRCTNLADFVRDAFAAVGIRNWMSHVVLTGGSNARRDFLSHRGDATYTRDLLTWTPSVSPSAIASTMVRHDINLLRGDETPWIISAGHGLFVS